MPAFASSASRRRARWCSRSPVSSVWRAAKKRLSEASAAAGAVPLAQDPRRDREVEERALDLARELEVVGEAERYPLVERADVLLERDADAPVHGARALLVHARDQRRGLSRVEEGERVRLALLEQPRRERLLQGRIERGRGEAARRAQHALAHARSRECRGLEQAGEVRAGGAEGKGEEGQGRSAAAGRDAFFPRQEVDPLPALGALGLLRPRRRVWPAPIPPSSVRAARRARPTPRAARASSRPGGDALRCRR